MKFLYFSGLKHHRLKMGALLDLAKSEGHEVLAISGDNPWAPLSADFQSTCIDGGYPYRMVCEWFDCPEFREKLDQYSKLSAAAWRESLQGGDPPSGVVVSSRLQYSLQELMEIRAGFEVALLDLRPDAVLVLHERNFWTRPLAVVASELKIPIFSFQEGVFYDIYDAKFLEGAAGFGDRVFLWGDKDYELFVEGGHDPNRLRAYGPMHLERWRYDGISSKRALRRDLKLDEERPMLLVIPPSDMLGGLSAPEWRALIRLQRSCPDLDVVVKWRPVHASAGLLQSIEREEGLALMQRADDDPYAIVMASDAVIGRSSTLLIEAVGLGVPSLELSFAGGVVAGVDAAAGFGVRRVASEAELIALGSQIAARDVAEFWPPADGGSRSPFAFGAIRPSRRIFSEIMATISGRAQSASASE